MAGFELRRFAGPVAYADVMAPLRVAHLTDLHVGRVTPMAVQRAAVALANEQKPDLVVLTGDFVCHSQLYLDELIEVVSGFSAPVFGVLGNHDHWSGADEVRWALKRGGVEVLDNAHSTVTLRGQKLQVLGLDDAYTGHAHREHALKGLRHDLPILGLSHIGEEADALWAAGVPLVLAGHTHGGQITFARLHEITLGIIGGHKYVHGLYGSRTGPPGQGSLYVGAGVGAAVLPLRVGDRARREVAVFELGVAPGAFAEPMGEQVPLAGRRPSPRTMRARAERVMKKRLQRARRNGGPGALTP